jgi:protein SCO1/2
MRLTPVAINSLTVGAGRAFALWNNRAMSTRYWTSIAAIAIAAAIAGFFLATKLREPAIAALEGGTVYPTPRALAPFDLLDAKGQAFTRRELAGKPTLVFFGFTHCPDVCPTTLALLNEVTRKANVPDLRVALISVDPERDTPENMGKYVAAFSPEFIGLTGTAPAIVAVTRDFGVAATRVDLPGGNYTVDHSAAIFALDREARIIAVFTPPFRSAALARDLVRLAPRVASRS